MTYTATRPVSRFFTFCVLLVALLLALPPLTHAQQTQLTADDGAEGDTFGSAVAISGDGQRAVVGARADDIDGEMGQGSAYVFTRDGSGSWSQEAKLVADDGAAFDELTSLDPGAVATNEDGTFAIAGAWLDDVDGNTDQGSAYIFARDGSGNWSQEQKLTVPGTSTFGIDVDMSADGQRAIVSSNQINTVFVFNRSSGGSWTLGATLGPLSGEFGRSAALSPDGQYILVGATAADGFQGRAYVYSRDDSGSWSQDTNFTSADGAGGEQFGLGIDISNGGEYALVSAPFRDVDGGADGTAYVYTRQGDGTYAVQTQLENPRLENMNDDNYGYSVSISDGGERALIGSRFDDAAGGTDDSNEGAAYVFRRMGDNWVEGPRLTADDQAENDLFGEAVSISSDGRYGIVGAKFHDVSGTPDQGSAYAFGPSSLPVELASFTAQYDGEAAVAFSWRTLTETNNRGFELQRRSAGAAQGGGWQTVGFIESQAAGGTSTESLSYGFRAEDVPYGTHTFRLVQVDLDGAETPSDITRTVEVALDQPYELSRAYPNPLRTRGTVDVTVQQAQEVTVSLYDALGRRVRTLHEGPLEGNNTEHLSVEVGDLASGVYFLRVRGENFSASQQVVVVR